MTKQNRSTFFRYLRKLFSVMSKNKNNSHHSSHFASFLNNNNIWNERLTLNAKQTTWNHQFLQLFFLWSHPTNNRINNKIKNVPFKFDSNLEVRVRSRKQNKFETSLWCEDTNILERCFNQFEGNLLID